MELECWLYNALSAMVLGMWSVMSVMGKEAKCASYVLVVDERNVPRVSGKVEKGVLSATGPEWTPGAIVVPGVEGEAMWTVSIAMELGMYNVPIALAQVRKRATIAMELEKLNVMSAMAKAG